MSGHSHWSGIKHKKGAADAKKAAAFGKLCAAITAAAKTESNPDFNPRLRGAIDRARSVQVPNESIERAINKAKDSTENLEELIFEAYGPGGVAILMEVVTDNRNRSVSEIKKVLSDTAGKWADPGSVMWAFEKKSPTGGEWEAKFKQPLSPEDTEKLNELIEELEDHQDIQRVHTNLDSLG